MTDFELAEIDEQDWRDFRDLRLRALAEAPGAFGSRHADWADAPEERWRDRLRGVPFNVLARSGGVPVGMVSATLEPDEAWLISMYVAPEARGSALAGRLVEQVVSWAADRGRPTALMVRSDNRRALAAYRRAGFVDEGVPADWPEDEPAENRMVRPLPRDGAPREGAPGDGAPRAGAAPDRTGG